MVVVVGGGDQRGRRWWGSGDDLMDRMPKLWLLHFTNSHKGTYKHIILHDNMSWSRHQYKRKSWHSLRSQIPCIIVSHPCRSSLNHDNFEACCQLNIYWKKMIILHLTLTIYMVLQMQWLDMFYFVVVTHCDECIDSLDLSVWPTLNHQTQTINWQHANSLR